MALLQQVAGGAQANASGARTGGAGGNLTTSLLSRDERTGETYLRLPVPKPEVLDQALRAVGALLESLRK
jgi:hypothetical protein